MCEYVSSLKIVRLVLSLLFISHFLYLEDFFKAKILYTSFKLQTKLILPVSQITQQSDI